MDEAHRRKPATNHRAPLFAMLLVLAVAGCKQLGLGNSKTENPVVPPPPDRKVLLESQTSSAKPAAGPVKLHGSAEGESATSIPNAPGIEGAPILAGMVSPGSLSADGSARLLASEKGTAGKTKNADHAAVSDSVAGVGGEMAAVEPAASGNADESGNANEPDESVEAGGSDNPRKNTHADNRETDDDAAKPDLELVSATDDVVTPIEIEGAAANFKRGQVAATVNGAPIFCEDVLRGLPEEVAANMRQIERAVTEGKVKPEEFRKYRRHVIENFMQQYIQQELLLQALKLKLKDEQLNGIKKQLDKVFDTEDLPAAMKKAGVTTTAELEQKLQAQGASIDSLRTASRNRQLAQQYLGTKAASNVGFDRPDVLKYYQENLKTYAITGKVKWEQIQLKFEQNGGKEGARKKAEEILKRLDAGEVFAVVAKECSNGPTASKGGLWSWTEQGSIKAKEIDAALFELPIGEISQPIETQKSFDIIRVSDRTDAGHQPFEEVQEDIRSHLKSTLFMRRVNELIKELSDKATIEKFTDKL